MPPHGRQRQSCCSHAPQTPIAYAPTNRVISVLLPRARWVMLPVWEAEWPVPILPLTTSELAFHPPQAARGGGVGRSPLPCPLNSLVDEGWGQDLPQVFAALDHMCLHPQGHFNYAACQAHSNKGKHLIRNLLVVQAFSPLSSWQRAWQLHPDPYAETETLGLAWTFKTSKPSLSGSHPPKRPCILIFLIFWNSAMPWWLSIQKYELVGDILNQTTAIFPLSPVKLPS